MSVARDLPDLLSASFDRNWDRRLARVLRSPRTPGFGPHGRGTMRLQKWRVLVVAAALAGCATSHPAHGAIAPPITAFSSSLRPFQYGALCSVSGRLHPDGPVEAVPSGPLRGNPLEVHAVWLPGLNDHQCRSTVATAGAPIAGRLVHDIETSPRQPPGPHSCPSTMAGVSWCSSMRPHRSSLSSLLRCRAVVVKDCREVPPGPSPASSWPTCRRSAHQLGSSGSRQGLVGPGLPPSNGRTCCRDAQEPARRQADTRRKGSSLGSMTKRLSNRSLSARICVRLTRRRAAARKTFRLYRRSGHDNIGGLNNRHGPSVRRCHSACPAVARMR